VWRRDGSSTAGAAYDFLAYVGYAANQQRHEHRGYCFLDIAFGTVLIG